MSPFRLSLAALLPLALALLAPMAAAVELEPITQNGNGDLASFIPSGHFAGTSPFSTSSSALLGLIAPPTAYPAGCTISQLHMHTRHGSRQPTAGTYKSLAAFAQTVYAAQPNMSFPTSDTSLNFLKSWQFILDSTQTEMLSQVGQQELFEHGHYIKQTYPSLLQGVNKSFTWSVNSQQRVLDSGSYFAIGALGLNYSQQLTWNVIPESTSPTAAGPSNLFGYDSCNAYNTSYTAGLQTAWQNVFIPPIVNRLNRLVSGFQFTASTVSTAQTMCNYETLTQYPGYASGWCTMFTAAEQLDFEYLNDINYLTYAYTNPNATALGGAWVQLMAQNLLKRNNTQGLFATFSHDNSMQPIISALGMYLQDGWTSLSSVPVTYNPYFRQFRAGSQVNMGGNFYVELFTCANGQDYVRLQSNQRVYPLTNCGSGPSGSPDGLCEVHAFLNSSTVAPSASNGLNNVNQLCNPGAGFPNNVSLNWF